MMSRKPDLPDWDWEGLRARLAAKQHASSPMHAHTLTATAIPMVAAVDRPALLGEPSRASAGCAIPSSTPALSSSSSPVPAASASGAGVGVGAGATASEPSSGCRPVAATRAVSSEATVAEDGSRSLSRTLTCAAYSPATCVTSKLTRTDAGTTPVTRTRPVATPSASAVALAKLARRCSSQSLSAPAISIEPCTTSSIPSMGGGGGGGGEGGCLGGGLGGGAGGGCGGVDGGGAAGGACGGGGRGGGDGGSMGGGLGGGEGGGD
mmetsp:Transcript_14828/g.38587  ORF Transcript_14828/g.38587 Transcript_14828/m.38587 type:complete len:265 (+) Transcript_14828:900-1694(+)